MSMPVMGAGRARQPLPIAALFAGNAISMTGNVLALVAIPWFVLQTTGSAAETGLTGFVSLLPVIVAGLIGGGLIDRLGFKRTSIVADLTSAAAIALIPLLSTTVGLAFWQLLVLVFFGNLFDAPGTTAREALVPDLAELAAMPMERAAAGIQAVERGSRMVGAPLAGLLIVFFNPGIVLWFDAATFLFSALLVAAAVPKRTPAADEEPPASYLHGLSEGLRFIWSDRLILAIVVTVMITNFLDAAGGSGVLLPVYANEKFGNALDLGLMYGLNGAGSVVGAVVFAIVGHRLPKRRTFIATFVVLSLRFWCLAAFPTLPAVLATMTIAGLAAGPINPILGTVEYERIPARLRGRVLGTITAGAYMAMPLGVLISGVALEGFPVEWVLVALGAVYFVTTTSMALNPALREMDRPPQKENARPELERA